MSTLGNESDKQDIPASLPIETPVDDHESSSDDMGAATPSPSEVKMRIDLLGKLIIPPTAP